MEILERRREEKERRAKINKDRELEKLRQEEEERQIQEAIEQSLQESDTFKSKNPLEGTNNETSEEKFELTDKHKEEKKEEDVKEEIKVYEYSELSSSDIIYSCVYNQYCRKAGTTPGCKLNKVKYFK